MQTKTYWLAIEHMTIAFIHFIDANNDIKQPFRITWLMSIQCLEMRPAVNPQYQNSKDVLRATLLQPWTIVKCSINCLLNLPIDCVQLSVIFMLLSAKKSAGLSQWNFSLTSRKWMAIEAAVSLTLNFAYKPSYQLLGGSAAPEVKGQCDRISFVR